MEWCNSTSCGRLRIAVRPVKEEAHLSAPGTIQPIVLRWEYGVCSMPRSSVRSLNNCGRQFCCDFGVLSYYLGMEPKSTALPVNKRIPSDLRACEMEEAWKFNRFLHGSCEVLIHVLERTSCKDRLHSGGTHVEYTSGLSLSVDLFLGVGS